LTRRTVTALILGSGLSLALAGAALATFQPTLLYKPPVIKATDIDTHNSVEDVTIRRDGALFTFDNEVSPFVLDPASDPGCEGKGGTIGCPREGVKKIIVKLGKKTVGKGTIKSGKVTLTLKKLKTGKNKLKATYAGDSSFLASKLKFTITVK